MKSKLQYFVLLAVMLFTAHNFVNAAREGYWQHQRELSNKVHVAHLQKSDGQSVDYNNLFVADDNEEDDLSSLKKKDVLTFCSFIQQLYSFLIPVEHDEFLFHDRTVSVKVISSRPEFLSVFRI